MQIAAHQSACPTCGQRLEIVPVLHHMICAYVGPAYDFTATDDVYLCPKCRRPIASGEAACEIVGTSGRCMGCGREFVVSPERAV